MRKTLIPELLKLAEREDFCFITGDLGFMVLEPLRERLGKRFINAGIAEQNMISVAAGLAREGFRPWVYSIAPFVYARPFEQVRNDIALHDLPVRLLGNGAGYGYGVQGATHHALEDVAVMRSLQHMQVYAPCCGSDLKGLVSFLADDPHPAYIRLGYDFMPKTVTSPEYAKFRMLLDGNAGVVFALGSMAGVVYPILETLSIDRRPALCACAAIPESVSELPEKIVEKLKLHCPVMTVEEHVKQGGLGESVALMLCSVGMAPEKMFCHCAQGYPRKRYGSQKYFWQLSGLDRETLSDSIVKLFQ